MFSSTRTKNKKYENKDTKYNNQRINIHYTGSLIWRTKNNIKYKLISDGLAILKVK